MVPGTDLAQQINALPEDQHAPLLEGAGVSIAGIAVKYLFQKALTWLSDENNQKKAIDFVSGFFKK